MRLHALGFRVTATLPGQIDRVSDDFELRQSAIECARRAERDGAINVRCVQIQQWRDGAWRDSEELLEVAFREPR